MAARHDTPLLICYDGSENSAAAIEGAAALFRDGPTLILTVWQPLSAFDSFAWPGTTTPSTVDTFELDRAAAERGAAIAREGDQIARQVGLNPEPLAIEATGSVWKTIIETARVHDARAIALGSRGLTGLGSILLGSVSSAVTHHADRPVLVIHHPDDENA
jgi:nucleotide-binding universal stress UspA family protein